MPTATLKKITKDFGLSLNDFVRYHKQNDMVIIEIDLKEDKSKGERKKDTIYELGNSPVVSGVLDGAKEHDKYIYQKNS